MSFYTNIKSVADKLLTKYGENLTFTRVTEGAYDVSDGSVAAGSTITYTAYCHPQDFSAEEIDNKTIQSGDTRLWVQKPTSYAPAVGDTVVLDSITLRVINVRKYRAQGNNAVFLLQLRA